MTLVLVSLSLPGFLLVFFFDLLDDVCIPEVWSREMSGLIEAWKLSLSSITPYERHSVNLAYQVV